MKKTKLLICTLPFIILSCKTSQMSDKSKEQQTSIESQSTAFNYPKTRKDNTIDTYFGKQIADPYRWLEDDRSVETGAWVKAQNEVTFNYLNQIPFQKQLKDQLQKLWNYEKIGSPFKRGENTYFYKNNGLQNQSVLFQVDKNGVESVFLDPNTFAKDGSTSLSQVSFSDDGKTLAYSISEAGSDWNKIIIMDVATKKQTEPTIIDVKFSGISWFKNEGFYYSSYDKPQGSELSAKTDQHKLYFHKLGTAQKDDVLVFGDKDKRRYVSGSVTEDNKYLVISAANSTYGNELYLKDLSSSNSPIVNFVNNFKNDNDVLDHKDGYLYIQTDLNAPNNRLVKTPVGQLTSENWQDVIPETENVLNVGKGAGYIFANYMKDAVSNIKQYDYNGQLLREVKLPGIGSAGGFGGKVTDKDLYFSFSNYVTPSTSYKYDPKSGESSVYQKPKIDFDPSLYESKQVFYTSKDGTKVPMIITYKKGTKLDGKNPTMLYGYGGFNVSLTPSFSVVNAVWLNNGGIYAVPNIRGGGEYGKKWHVAGTRLQKQNVFDDFIAAAEYLIKEKYTSANYLAIKGGSNGGLLVGACMTQRPELFKVALPAVGVLDMLRYHTFTAGAGWAYDYGTSTDNKDLYGGQDMFNYLLGYSPQHNVKKGTAYPATLVTTGDHDDRVVPAHSFKFAAELQDKHQGKNPVMIRIETNAGHGAGKPTAKVIEENADVMAFSLFNMGIKSLK